MTVESDTDNFSGKSFPHEKDQPTSIQNKHEVNGLTGVVQRRLLYLRTGTTRRAQGSGSGSHVSLESPKERRLPSFSRRVLLNHGRLQFAPL